MNIIIIIIPGIIIIIWPRAKPRGLAESMMFILHDTRVRVRTHYVRTCLRASMPACIHQ